MNHGIQYFLVIQDQLGFQLIQGTRGCTFRQIRTRGNRNFLEFHLSCYIPCFFFDFLEGPPGLLDNDCGLAFE